MGMWYVLDVPSGFMAAGACLDHAEYQGFGRPRKPRLRTVSAGPIQRSDELPEEAWREITVAEGTRGHAATFSAPRGCDRPAGASPAKSTGPSTERDGRHYPMLRRIPRWTPLTLA